MGIVYGQVGEHSKIFNSNLWLFKVTWLVTSPILCLARLVSSEFVLIKWRGTPTGGDPCGDTNNFVIRTECIKQY